MIRLQLRGAPWRHGICSSAFLTTLVAVALSPAVATAQFAPDDLVLPDRDVRSDVKPSDPPKGQTGLERKLGEQGFVDADARTGAISFVGRTDGFLTTASTRPARDVALDFVDSNREAFGLDSGDIDALELTERYRSWDGVTHLTWSQVSRGVPSFDTYLRANVTGDGRLINVSGAPVGDLSLDDATPELSARDALAAARDDVGGDDDVSSFGELESADLVFLSDGSKERLAWRVYVDSASPLLYEEVIDAATGEVLVRQSRTDFLNQADVWDLNPTPLEAPSRVNLGADPTWIDRSEGGTKLQGNNTHTYSDINDNDFADPSEEVPQAGGDWIFPITFFNQAECPPFRCTWDSTNVATKATNRAQSTTQLFYLVNRFHDHLLAPPIGFDEASRNFEHVNSTGTGIGGDAINAEASDGGALNNANFATPADGAPGRMQMYFFDFSWDVASNDDAEIVYHEFAHGLSNRLLGNGSGLKAFQSGAMGEAWSDWYGQDFVVDDGQVVDGPGPDLDLGDYSFDLFGQGGVRRQEIDCKVGDPAVDCPGSGIAGSGGYTFGDLGKVGNPFGVHDNGEIWAETLWDLRDALGSETARALITGGLRLSPNNPTFLQMRDAILQTATVLGEPQAPVWAVFAARGMGVSATTPNADSNVAVEAFDTPSGDITPPNTTIVSGPTGTTTDNTPTFAFSSNEAGSTFQCSIDAGAFGACSGPGATHTTATLPDGPHTFAVRAIDPATNVDASPASRAFTVDTIPPDTTIGSGPSGAVGSTSASFGFSSSEPGSGFQCKLDGEVFTACTSPKGYAGLAAGPHTFAVRATDAAGNTDLTPSERTFTVSTSQPSDATPPETTIAPGPKKFKKNKAKFTFSSNEANSSFECQVDAKAFAGCSSPLALKGLKRGKHTLLVRATDAANNVDATPAKRDFKIKRKKKKGTGNGKGKGKN